MKRLICCLMILALMIPAAFAAEPEATTAPFEVHLSTEFGDVGDEVVVMGYVRNAPRCASYRVIFTYDTAVLQPVSGKSLDPEGMAIANINAKYPPGENIVGDPAINCLAAHQDRVVEGDMELFAITFKIIGEPKDNVTPINLRHYEFFDGTIGKPQAKVPDSVTVGSVYTSALLEPTMLLQTLLGTDYGFHYLDVDRNGDRLISVADVVLCLRALAEKE